MKILVTGANGMLGNSIQAVCGNFNHNLICTDIKNLDITDKLSIKSYIKKYHPDTIINCAAYTNVDSCETNPELAYKINAQAPLNLAELCSEYKIRLCHISTDYVYADDTEKQKTESHKINPKSVYGKSKLQGELNIINNMEDYYILRTAWMFGYFGNNFLKWIIENIKQQIEIPLIYDCFGNPTYSIDLAEIIFKIIETDKFSIYNVSNTGSASWYEFGDFIIKNLKQNVNIKKVSYKDLNRKAERPVNSIMDITKIQNTLNIEIGTWQDAVKKCLKHITV
jgi:dTDP-4-dehydrorhamnose reductase